MTAFSIFLLNILATVSPSPAATAPVDVIADAPPAQRFAEVTIRRSVIIKVPVRPMEPPVKWKEKGSRKCISIDSIAAASVLSPEALDLVLRGGERWRLKFRGKCPAISFYRGFYLRPGEDRQICARRDVIHPRSGGECEIQTFRRLKPVIDD